MDNRKSTFQLQVVKSLGRHIDQISSGLKLIEELRHEIQDDSDLSEDEKYTALLLIAQCTLVVREIVNQYIPTEDIEAFEDCIFKDIGMQREDRNGDKYFNPKEDACRVIAHQHGYEVEAS